MKSLSQKLENYIKSFLKNAGKKGVVLGVSGGLDSAILATLCKNSLGEENIRAFLLPTKDSEKKNIKDALKLCKGLNIKHKLIYIDDIIKSFSLAGAGGCLLTRGNLCARIRMCLLYDASANYNFLVIGSSNKSELMLGYGTIYGDLAYAFNPLGDLYKSELYELGAYLQIDESILKKPPTADLWPNQSDEEEIGYSYSKIDEFLKAYEKGLDLTSFDTNMRQDLEKRINTNAFKARIGDIYKNDLDR